MLIEFSNSTYGIAYAHPPFVKNDVDIATATGKWKSTHNGMEIWADMASLANTYF